MATCRCGRIYYADETPDPAGALCAACWKKSPASKLKEAPGTSPEAAAVLLTTETAPNLPIGQRLGIVSSECVVGVNALKDLFSLGRDIFGGRSETLQSSLKEARNAALNDLRDEAANLGADAIVGVSLTHTEISGGGKSMLMVAAFGTAVKLQP